MNELDKAMQHLKRINAANRMNAILNYDVRNGFYQFIKNHCIIQVNAGRKSGHTSFIRENCGKNDVIVGLNLANLKSIKNCALDQSPMFTKEEIMSGTERTYGLYPGNVFVDNASYFGDETLDKVIKTFAGFSDPHITFFFLG